MEIGHYAPAQNLKGETPPYTHEEYFETLHGGVLLVCEDVREPEQTSSIAGRALWEHDDRTVCSLPHLFQTLVLLLVIGGLERVPSGMGDHVPKRDNFEPENFCARGWLPVFGGECGGI